MNALTQGASIAEVAIRLVVAALIGGVIGWDRERSEKPAGIRTHMLVSLGSASFTLLGFEVGLHLSSRSDEDFDPTRVLQGVVGGIGFLGAGAIIQNRGQVSGITTAASVWVAGALGAAAGVGAYVLALGTALLALIILMSAGKLEALVHADKVKAPQARSEPPTEPPMDPGETTKPPLHAHRPAE